MRIGTVKGIEIKLHLSTLVIVGLVGFYAAQLYFSLTGVFDIVSMVIVGLINGFIILGSVIAHELLHSIVSLRHGLNVSEIELYMFGGVSNIEEEPKTPRSETIISAAGPAASLLIGIVFLALYYIPTLVFGITLPPILAVTFWYSGLSNTGLGLFNLIPAFPMDGGRVLRAFLWKRRDNLLSATETASKIGYYFGWAMVGFGFIEIIFLGTLGGFWFIILGFFLSNSSRNAYQQTVYEFKLSKISAGEILTKPEQKIPFDIKIKDAVQDYFMNYRKSYFPVEKDGEIVGVVTIDSLKNIPPNQRAELIIGKAMKDIKKFPNIKSEETAKEAFTKIQREEVEPRIIIVKDNGTVAGFITKDEIQSAIRLSDLLFGEKV